jgi:ssRNA-specific RNase YbeY (16S rRNA maturation enzyme)
MIQVKEFGMTYENLVGLMLVHGMLHLKGHDHGEGMEKLEEKWSKKFGFIYIS